MQEYAVDLTFARDEAAERMWRSPEGVDAFYDEHADWAEFGPVMASSDDGRRVLSLATGAASVAEAVDQLCVVAGVLGEIVKVEATLRPAG